MKWMVLIGIVLLFAGCSGDEPQEEARLEELSVQANMHALHLAVVDYSVIHEGNYPADTYDFSDMLSARFANPFGKGAAYCSGKPGFIGTEGAVYYEHEEYGFSPYTIYGCGKDGKVLFLTLFGGGL